jgi:hypothetical protein
MSCLAMSDFSSLGDGSGIVDEEKDIMIQA